MFGDRFRDQRPQLKATLTDNAQRWLRLAVEVQATKELLEKWSEKRRSQAG